MVSHLILFHKYDKLSTKEYEQDILFPNKSTHGSVIVRYFQRYQKDSETICRFLSFLIFENHIAINPLMTWKSRYEKVNHSSMFSHVIYFVVWRLQIAFSTQVNVFKGAVYHFSLFDILRYRNSLPLQPLYSTILCIICNGVSENVNYSHLQESTNIN